LFAAGLATLFRTDRLLSYLPPLTDLALDWRVAAFALVAAMATVFLAAGLPSLVAARVSPRVGFGLSMRGSQRGGRVRSVLIAVQVALSIALLASAGVLGQTLLRLENVDLVFNPDEVLSVPLQPRDIGYDDAQTTTFFRELEARLNATPGIARAGYAWSGHLSPTTAMSDVRRTDEGPQSLHRVSARIVSAHYLSALGIPLRAGRTFSVSEAEQEPPARVVIVDEALAQLLFGETAALGRQIVFSLFGDRTPTAHEVIGVVGNSGAASIREGFPPTLYSPAGASLRIATFHVRSSLPAADAASVIRRVMRELAPGLPAPAVSTMREDLGRLVTEERLMAKLGVLLSLIALGIAVAGIYAVVAYAVGERTREFGIRLALGASPQRVRIQVLRGALGVCGAGAAGGLVLYAWAARWLDARLYGVSSLDLPTLTGVATLVVLCTLLAAWHPARRALKVDPATTLRAE
jgi:predicted permease